jgi:GcrA cell cycle regulator
MPRNDTGFWTDERVNILKIRWKDNASLEGIGRELGCTRQAVAGKVRRLKLTGKSKEQIRASSAMGKEYKPRAKKSHKKKLVVAIVVPVIKQPPPPNAAHISFGVGKTLIEINSCDCRWPIGDPQDANFFYCAAPRDGDSPYCENHTGVAYR